MIDFGAFSDELQKIAGLKSVLLNPAIVGAGLGAAGGAIAPGESSRLMGAARGAATGGAIGAGVRYLPKAIRSSKTLKPLHQYAGDIGWMAPSLLAAPAVVQGVRSKRAKNE